MISEKILRLSLLLALSGVFIGTVLLIGTDALTTARASSGAHHSAKWSEVVWLFLYLLIGVVLAYRRPAVGAGYAIVAGIGSIVGLGTAVGFIGLFFILGWGGVGPQPGEILLFGCAAFGLISGVALTLVSTRLALLSSRRENAKYPLLGVALAIVCALLIVKLSQ